MRPSTPAPEARDVALASAVTAELAPLLASAPVTGSRAGLQAACAAIEGRLRALGFTIAHHPAADGPPVVVATRPGTGPHWIGLSGHYDVELGGAGWTADPFIPVCREGRLYGRGTADNLGPLLLRLTALAGASRVPSLVWVLQGEEEIGSPAAHAIYPELRLPPVSLWLEETGYFELDGRQRVLLRRPSSVTTSWVGAALELATGAGRGVDVHDRYLNKAFGAHRCPFLTHLVGDATYLAIGPNDPRSSIHGADESVPLHNLALSVDQFIAVLRAAAEAA
jgi:acetylornithine deacetylase/succinyl-diaminopimelate desuccinylase-like protein